MTATTTERPATPVTLTVGVLRDLLADAASDLEVHVGVWDSNCFNVMIGTVPVTAGRVSYTAQGGQLLLRVPGIS